MEASKEWQKAQRGELYRSFVPELLAARDRCYQACNRFNNTTDTSRRKLVELWRGITEDKRPLPPQAATPEEDKQLFEDEPWVGGPIRADYGFNIRLGNGVQINWNSTWVDTCPIQIGARTLVGPNCSFYSGTHPLDPAVRNGTKGPEIGKEINIGEDCWLGGNVTILPGITIGRGCTIGAGSVVTKDVPAFHVAAGNPAKVLKRIATTMDPDYTAPETEMKQARTAGPEEEMKQAD